MRVPSFANPDTWFDLRKVGSTCPTWQWNFEWPSTRSILVNKRWHSRRIENRKQKTERKWQIAWQGHRRRCKQPELVFLINKPSLFTLVLEDDRGWSFWMLLFLFKDTHSDWIIARHDVLTCTVLVRSVARVFDNDTTGRAADQRLRLTCERLGACDGRGANCANFSNHRRGTDERGRRYGCHIGISFEETRPRMKTIAATASVSPTADVNATCSADLTANLAARGATRGCFWLEVCKPAIFHEGCKQSWRKVASLFEVIYLRRIVDYCSNCILNC